MVVLAALVDVASSIGYPLLFALIMFESSGLPVPGETALITAAIAASKGHLRIEEVMALAAAAAIIGDNIGYLVSRRYGRALLEAPGPLLKHRLRVLEVGEPFFDRHGNKAVFAGRWIAGLRVWASWLAGATGMPWRTFTLYNALGGICWALTVGLLAYALGHTVENIFVIVGIVGAALALIAIVHHIRRKPSITTP